MDFAIYILEDNEVDHRRIKEFLSKLAQPVRILPVLPYRRVKPSRDHVPRSLRPLPEDA